MPRKPKCPACGKLIHYGGTHRTSMGKMKRFHKACAASRDSRLRRIWTEKAAK